MVDVSCVWSLGGFLALALVVGACSDDGLAPDAAADEVGSGGTTGGPAATSSVNTSATITASGTGDDGESPGGSSSSSGGAPIPPPDDTTGDEETGFDSIGETESDDGPESTTGGVGEPPCVGAEDCVCDPMDVICEVVPPVCPPGTVAEVDPIAMCWTFACVPAQSCITVPDCLPCTMDQACLVLSEGGGLSFACEPIPPECMDVATCECMPDVCPMPLECVPAPPKGRAELGCIE